MQIREYIEENCDIAEVKGGEYRLVCPECGSDESFYFNVDKKVGQCFRSKNCSSPKFNDITLVAVLEGISNSQAMKMLGYKEGDVKQNRISQFGRFLKSRNRKVEVEETTETYNKAKTPYNFIRYATIEMLHRHLKKRKYKFSVLKHFNVGYCSTGKYHHRIIIPIKTNDNYTFQARRLYDKDDREFPRILKKLKTAKEINLWKQKYLNPYGHKKEFILYNYNQTYKDPYLVVVESPKSVWRLYQYGYQAVAILGSSISSYQIDLLSMLSLEYMIFCLDPDAFDKAKEQLEQLKIVCDTRMVKLPDHRDPDDLSKKEVKEFIINASKVTKYSGLKTRLRGTGAL